MYIECGEPEQVKHIWNFIVNNHLKPTSASYGLILTACAYWAKKDGTNIDEILRLGEFVHRYAVSAHVL